MYKKFVYITGYIALTYSLFVHGSHAVTLSAQNVAEQHGITTTTLVNNAGKECVVPQESLSLMPSLCTICGDSPIACGNIPTTTMETIAQALWSFYYAKQLPTFDIMQHVALDAGLPSSTPEELASLHHTAHALQFELLDTLCQIPMISIVSTKEGEKQKRFAVPSQQAMYSEKIKEYAASPTFAYSKEVMLPMISGQELRLLAQTLWNLHDNRAAQDPAVWSKAIIKDTIWGSTPEEQLATSAKALKIAEALNTPALAELAANVVISQASPEQLVTFLEQFNHDLSIKTFITQHIIKINSKDQSIQRDKIGFSIKEKWHMAKKDLVNNRLNGTRFDLSDHNINTIEGLHHLPNVHKVTELILSDNKLSQLDTNHFTPLTSLTMLDLSHNNLHELDIAPLLSIPSLRTIKLRGNQLSPDVKQKISKQVATKNVEILF